MKNLFFLLLLTVGCTFLACNKGDDGPSEFFTATIDGQAFESDVTVALEDNSFGEPIIFILGTETASGDRIGLNLPLSTSLNTSLAIDATDFALTFTDTGGNAFFTVGTIALTEIDETAKAVAGTFSFVATQDDDATNVRTITNGEFRVIYL